jgi:UDP-galactopyranose mutase
MTTKAQRLSAMKSGDLKYQTLVFDALKVRQYGNTAVANYHVTGKTITRAVSSFSQDSCRAG